MTDYPSCEDRVEANLRGRIEDIRILWAGLLGLDCPECDGEGVLESGAECPICEGEGVAPEYHPDLGRFEEYGLGFWYVPLGTYEDQSEGWFVWQLSTGGPGDEFRFFVGFDGEPYRIEYWFLDWFDGAKRILGGDDLDLLMETWENEFKPFAQHEYDKAVE